MKIAILTSGILPVPAVNGGAVENHIDFYLKYNNEHKLHDMTVFSVWDKKIVGHPALKSTVNHYQYIETKTFWAKISRNIHRLCHGEGYYHHTIEHYFRQAWKRIQKQHFDIILLDNRPGYAVYIDVPQDCQLFLYLHNDLLNNHTQEHQQIYDKASRILTVSNYISSCVKTINPNDTKCFSILNGIDLEAFSPNITTQVSRDTLSLSADDFVLVFSGRITKEKGVDELITSMIRLRHYQNIKLLIIGSPFYGDTANEDDFVKELKKKAEAIKDRIRFTGFIPYAQMPDYVKMADVAVIPSLWDDPCPNTVLEAQAMGLPIITTKRGGIPEEVTEENAIMLNTDDNFIDNLTAAIQDLYNHPEKREKMGKASLVHSKYYNEQRYAQDFFKALEQVK
ncbi:MAG: glycosyltransferase family 4 protein [Prevotella sp.]|nr:glycosyltransferase family 4 protein [Prevotella sp.]